MQLPALNIARIPAIEGNLKGISEVRLELQLDSPRMTLQHWFKPAELRRRLELQLMQATIVVNPFARQALVVGVDVEPRSVKGRRGEGRAVGYHVTASLRELALLSRTALGLPIAQVERIVDSWSHKGIRGLVAPKTPAEKVVEMLCAEAESQVREFIADWRRDAGVAGVLPLTPQPLDPRAGRECVRILLGSVAGPVEEKQEEITADNTLPAPASKITVRMSRTTKTDLFAEICGSASLLETALPQLTLCAEDAALAVTLAAIVQDPVAAAAPFRIEFLRRVTQLTGPLAAPPSISLMTQTTTSPWQLFQ